MQQRIALILLTLCLALLIYMVLSMEVISNAQGLVAYTLILLGYLYLETRSLRARDSNLIWINPVVVASILTFVVAFGVSNIIYFFPEDILVLVGLQPIATPWMNQLMFLVILGAISMWVGYGSSFGRSFAKTFQRSRLLRKLIRPSLLVNKHVVYLCILLSLISKLIAIKLGIYGYTSNYDSIIESASYSQYLNMADSLGKVALIVVALKLYSSSRPSLSDRHILWIVLSYEVGFGILSGMKSAVIMPFIIVGLAYYSQRNRFPRWLMPTVLVGLMTAYAIIEPFRAAYNESSMKGDVSVSSIVSAITTPSNTNDVSGRASTGLSVLSRTNQTYIASLGIEYADNYKELPQGSPAFLNNIILAPAHALIPRFLWNSKPIENNGLWYTNEVVGNDSFSSTAMSPFTYLNFAGGSLAVIVGFFVVGVTQRGLFEGLRHFGSGGVLVFFGLFGTLVNIDNSFNSFFINIIRLLPILVILQYLLLRKSYK
ncbi:MAG TPA: hypothetical protein VIO87_08120 [Methylotenera sp.]